MSRVSTKSEFIWPLFDVINLFSLSIFGISIPDTKFKENRLPIFFKLGIRVDIGGFRGKEGSPPPPPPPSIFQNMSFSSGND